jgi:uncharacterized protein YutE (UPF0331/DUF86 family)
MTDLVMGKIVSLQRCIERARTVYARNPETFLTDFDQQDAAVLNVIRACELAIDIANHAIRKYKMGIPKSSAESFSLIQRAGVIPHGLGERLEKMVAFRNVSVHEYTALDYSIVASVITKDLVELLRFADLMKAYLDVHPS